MDPFVAGAVACRETMARFVGQGAGGPHIAESIRANWDPAWGIDPGRVSDEQMSPQPAMWHFAIVSGPMPEPNETIVFTGLPRVVHAFAFDPVTASTEVSRMKAAIFTDLGKMGSIRPDYEQAMLAYRNSIRVMPVTTYGV